MVRNTTIFRIMLLLCLMACTAAPAAQKIIGYYPNWSVSSLVNTLPYSQLTHINWAFVYTNQNGDITMESWEVSNMEAVLTKAHQNGVAFVISYRDDSYTPTMLANATLRQKVAKNLVQFALDHNCDGVDIDIEGSGYATNLGHFAQEVRNEIGTHPLTLSAAVSGPVDNNSNKFTDEFLAAMDWINPMVYDEAGTWPTSHFGDHAPMSEFTGTSGGPNGWRTRIAKEKICLGVPFYGYKFPSTSGGMGTYMDYKEILAQYPNQQASDNIAGGLTWYNGPDEITTKAQFVKDEGLGGIMIWDLNADVHDERSLLTAINTVIQPTNGPYTITVTAPHGTVTVSPLLSEYEAGSTVTLSVEPDAGWLFGGWSTTPGDTASTKTITITTNVAISPIFGSIDDQIVDGNFASVDNAWSFVTGNNANGTGEYNNESYKVSVANNGTNTWDLQLRQKGLVLIPGNYYTLQFSAWADQDRTLAWNVGGSVSPWPSYLIGDSSVAVSTTKKVFTKSFLMTNTVDANARVEFNGGLTGGTWYIDDVSLVMGLPDVTNAHASQTVCTFTPTLTLTKKSIVIALSTTDQYSVGLYSLSGKLIRSASSISNLIASSCTLDRSGIARGSYLLRVSGTISSYTSKIILEQE